MKGRMKVANTICHEGYGRTIAQRDQAEFDLSDKIVFTGAVMAIVLVSAVVCLWGVSMGIFPDPALLN